MTPADSSPYDAYALAATPDGDAFYWGANAAGDPGGEDGTWQDAFLAERGVSGWSNRWITQSPPTAPTMIRGFFPSMETREILFAPMANLVPEDQNNTDPFLGDTFDLYRSSGDSVELLSGAGPTGLSQPEVYATPDLGTVVFLTRDDLADGDADGAQDVYLRGPAGLRLISVGPDGQPDNSGSDVGVPTQQGLPHRTGFPATNGYNPLSEDGASVVLETYGQLDPVADTDFENDLYLWRNGAVRLITRGEDAPQEVPATFEGMSHDASSIYFTTTEALLPAADTDSAKDIYRYAPDAAPAQRLTLVSGSGAADANVVSVARNGQLFFLSTDRMGTNPPPGSTPVIYRAWNGVLEPVAHTNPFGDAEEFGDEPQLYSGFGTGYPGYEYYYNVAGTYGNVGKRPVRTNDDGTLLAFTTRASLDPADGDDKTDVYLWRAGQGITLLSPGGSGVYHAVLGGAVDLSLRGTSVTGGHGGGRGLTADGSEVFFTTAEALTAEAPDNGRAKVYGWRSGALELITSSAPDAAGAYYVDSSTDGRDVFIYTTDSLVSGDADGGAADVYDARVGGGFPQPAPSEVGSTPSGGGAGIVPAPPAPPSAMPAPPEPPPAGDDQNQPNDPARPTVDLRPSVLRVSGRRIALALEVSAPGRIRAVLRRGRNGRVLARGSAIAETAGDIALTLRLTKAGRKAARRGARRTGTLRIVLIPAEGDRAVETARVTVRSAGGGKRGS